MRRGSLRVNLLHERTSLMRSADLSLRMAGVAGLATALSTLAASAGISWSVPEDGGTPRDSNRIERIGPREFRIRASFEDGGQSVLRHAVSRVDLLCRNDGEQAATVTVHMDLS